ncbi:MAG: hydrogenase maturation protease [Gemmatimonadaceae bacterium]
MRVLIAGFGNVLRGDDGFGVDVLRRLGERGFASDSVELLDVGTGGIRLAQELTRSYDRLIIVDATTRGGTPGTLYTLAIDSVTAAREIDMHTTMPSSALAVAKALGALPPEIFLVGCEPAEVDEFSIGLTPVVNDAAEAAVEQVRRLLGSHVAAHDCASHPTTGAARSKEDGAS